MLSSPIKILTNDKSCDSPTLLEISSSSISVMNPTWPVRKNRSILTNIDDIEKKSSFTQKHDYADNVVITKAVKQKDGESGKSGSCNSLNKEMDLIKELIRSE